MFSNRFTTFAVVPLLAVAIAGKLTAADPRDREDGSWITISGTAVSPSEDAFTLDYGRGTIRVEMDDWDDYAEGYRITDGNRVTVSGVIDDGFFERKSIDASYVYDQDLNSYFYANAADEEYSYWYGTRGDIILGETTLYGTVTEIDPDDESFVLDTDRRTVTVVTDTMYYNPLDKVGYQRIEVGDRVSVSGQMDNDFFSAREFEASSVTTTYDASKWRNQDGRNDRNDWRNRNDRPNRNDQNDEADGNDRRHRDDRAQNSERRNRYDRNE